MALKIATDHGWPKASDGSDGNAFAAFKNERDYINQSGHMNTAVAAMDWAAREIERLQDTIREAHEALTKSSLVPDERVQDATAILSQAI